jgi:hypothetical protein
MNTSFGLMKLYYIKNLKIDFLLFLNIFYLEYLLIIFLYIIN